MMLLLIVVYDVVSQLGLAKLTQRYFDWKSSGLSASFQTHLNNCAHYAECRICEWTRRRLIEIETKADAAAEVAAMS
jgi:hypothetical protein